jgi:hypothetical protein
LQLTIENSSLKVIPNAYLTQWLNLNFHTTKDVLNKK